MNYQNYNNNSILYVIPQNKTNTTTHQMTTPISENTTSNNKRLHSYTSSDSLCKRRRVSPLSINTRNNNYQVYVQNQLQQPQPIIVTNYYKPQPQPQQPQQPQYNNVVIYNPQLQPQPQPKQQQTQQQSSKSQQQKPIDISNQFKVTQVTEVFEGCSELSLPKLFIYLIYKIWCCCNLSQYQSAESPMGFNQGYLSPKSAPVTPNGTSQFSSEFASSVNYSLVNANHVHARILSPLTPSNNYYSISDLPKDKVNALYKNICQSKIFQEQPKGVIKNHSSSGSGSSECVIIIDSDDEDSTTSPKKETFKVDPKDLETQILKASSRSCKGELKNNYSKLINYVDHLLKITQISFSSVILALEYIYRLKEASQTPEGKFLNQWSYEEIIPIAFMMANKYVSDDRYSNTVWANVTNINLNHLNELEMKGLVAISFRLYVSETNYNKWIALIKRVSHDLTQKFEQLRQPTSTSSSSSTPSSNKNVSMVSYKLSPNPYVPISSSSTSTSTSTSTLISTKNNNNNNNSSLLTTPSSNLNTALYSPMTPTRVQHVKKVITNNIYMARTSVATNPSSHVIKIVPQQTQVTQKPQQLLPTLPVTRVFKAQSQPTIITIPANSRLNVTVPPFQDCIKFTF
ncbi:hypothetical protein H8356DRAFT_1302028 [Neocallimastix lanati (nom. inval.)]|nr:hypothetical protein H8356DRAFT_1302028 [Neocallimastix sp. JGI-2020a]